jgi:hypothetical protein
MWPLLSDPVSPSGYVDLLDLVRRLADRETTRTEANVQSDLHTLLIAAGLNLGDAEIKDITLEAQVGARRRIDVEVGSAVFEVKRDLRPGNVLRDAIEQLADYVRTRTATLGRRYAGVLTDGAEWRLYHLVSDHLEEATVFTVPPVPGVTDWSLGSIPTTA